MESWLTMDDIGSNEMVTSDTLVYNYYGAQKDNHAGEIPEDAIHLIVDDALTEIGESAFNGWEFLLTVQLPTGLRMIGMQAFYECISLTSIEIPAAVEEIGYLAFAQCCSLVEVKLHQGLRVIGDRSFVDCISLVEVVLPDTLTGIQEGAFMGCISLTSMKVPSSVQEIGAHACCNCVKMVSIDLPEGLKRVSRGAFACCTSLRNVLIPSTVRVIDNIAFHNCNNLLSIEIPDGLEEIGWHAFAGCSSLANIAIPATVPFVHEDAFRDCHVIKRSYSSGTALNKGLRNRFQSLPVHKLCYNQAYLPTASTIQRLRHVVWQEEASSMIDECGMSPLHLLAMSAKANFPLVQALLKLYPIEMLSKKDVMGYSPLYYLSLNSSQEATQLIKAVLHELLSYQIRGLGLERWRLDVATAIDLISNHGISERTKQICNVYVKVATYERMEVISLLEQVIWKLKICEEQSFGVSQTDEDGRNNIESAKMFVSRSLTNLNLDNVIDRQLCRINCRAQIIISNTVPFLETLDEDEYSSWS